MVAAFSNPRSEFFCFLASFRFSPFKALDGDHGQVPLVKRAQNAIQRALIGADERRERMKLSFLPFERASSYRDA
jgi:hypothetical protein